MLIKVSHNLYAETLLNNAGAAAYGLGTRTRHVAVRTPYAWGIPRAPRHVRRSVFPLYNYVTSSTLTAVLGKFTKTRGITIPSSLRCGSPE